MLKRLSGFIKYLNPREFWFFVADFFSQRKLLLEMARKDFKNKFLGSFFGVLWAFVQPMVIILVLWFVFQVGFKAAPVADFPFILWLMTGMILWFFISDSMSTGVSSIIESAFLVKKIKFRVSLLPIVKIFSSLIVHSFFLILLFILFFVYGFYPTIFTLQLIYYLLATVIFLAGVNWISSSINVFFRDTSQIVQVFLQFGFWLTPIFWDLKMIPDRFQIYLKLNPVFYLIQGYRDSLINRIWFWEYPRQTLYFWLLTLIVFMVGAVLFRKLRPHFADVL